MSKGLLSEEHLTKVRGVVERARPSQSFFFSNTYFPTVNWDTDTIEWDLVYNTGGMTPFVAPGAQAPVVGGDGSGKKTASVAFFKEKSFIDEVMLNNLRKPGTVDQKMRYEAQLARRTAKLVYRHDARMEWMAAKCIVEGGFTYRDASGMIVSVDYMIPSMNKVTLAGNYVWGTGSTRVPQQDMFNAKIALSENWGITDVVCVMNTTTMKLLLWDSTIADLLKKSAYGDGDLFRNPTRVLGELLGVGPIRIYDDMYTIPAYLTANVTGGVSTTIYLDDVHDFEVGGTARFEPLNKENTFEDRSITAVDVAAGTITVASAPASSYKAGRDRVTMRKCYVPDNKVILQAARSAEGELIGEYAHAPYDLNGRYGRSLDQKEDWDPAGVWLRIQNKCLPINRHPEATYILTVK